MALGPVMLDLDGPELSAAERELLTHPRVGGVILFRRNFVDPKQLQALIRSIRRLRTPSLLVAVDQEGGRVQRFDRGFTTLPAAARLGALHDHDPERARRIARTLGWLLAAELRAVDVDVSFAPVLDLDRGISAVIGERALHSDPEVVAVLGEAVMRGMATGGMAAVAKHFPGHGSVAADSHHRGAVDPRPVAEILAQDARPFRHLAGAGLAAIMPAHVCYPEADAEPAGFSAFWLEQILRQDFQFSGAIFSDDLSMAAVGHTPPGERAERALAAGCDMVLVCNDRAAAEAVIDHLGDAPRPLAQARLMRMHGRPGAPTPQRLQRRSTWQRAHRLAQRLAQG